jgi:hypothetical protein
MLVDEAVRGVRLQLSSGISFDMSRLIVDGLA